MGSQFSRTQYVARVARDAKGKSVLNRSSDSATKPSRVNALESGAIDHYNANEKDSCAGSSGASSGLRTVSNPENAAADWSKLLTSISGSITSQPWHGTVGVSSKSGRDPSMHASQRSKAYVAKQPRGLVPGSSEMRARQATAPGQKLPQRPEQVVEGEEVIRIPLVETGRNDSCEALEEISRVFNENADAAAEMRRGRLSQNDVIDLFRVRRESNGQGTQAHIANKFGLSVEDAQHLLRFSRTVLAVEISGIARGLADPKRKIERFEDVQ